MAGHIVQRPSYQAQAHTLGTYKQLWKSAEQGKLAKQRKTIMFSFSLFASSIIIIILQIDSLFCTIR
jgi:hypothetical protein